MTDERRKFLTEKLGEPWHEHGIGLKPGQGRIGDICSCGTNYSEGDKAHDNRTFTIPQDYFDLMENIDVEDFITWLGNDGDAYEYHEAWYKFELLTPAERCGLICDFLMEDKKK